MTVSTTDNVVEYSSGGPAFPIPYRFLRDQDIVAVLMWPDETIETLVLGTQFTLTGAGSQSGGTLTSAYASSMLNTPGAVLTIAREMVATQETDLRNQGRYFAETHENVFDRLTMLIQQGFSGFARALRRPLGSENFDAESRRIENVATPVNSQDAANKIWTEQRIAGLIEAGQGPLNLASNVLYVNPDGTPGVVQDLSDAVKGAAMIGFQAAGAGAVARSLRNRQRHEAKYRVNLIDYMTEAMLADVDAGTYQVDTVPAWTAAQNALPLDGGWIIAPGGTLAMMSKFTLRHAVSAEGNGAMYSFNGTDPGCTVLVPRHNGEACLSLQGANGCELRNFTIKAYPDLYPKTGMVMGRSTSASAGQHHINTVSVLGHFSVAGICSVASEDILLTKPYVWIFGGGAKYCFATGISDSFGVGGGLVVSSNLHITMLHPFFINSSADANASCMYFEGAQATGNVTVVGGYLIAFSGAYIHLNMGAVDGQSPIGTWTFCGVNGERLSGGDPLYGFRVTAAGTQTLKGLTINGGRFDLLSSGTTTHYDILIPGNVTLDAPNAVMPPPESFPYATSQVTRRQIKGGVFSVGRFALWSPLAFGAGWSNSFGTPYAGGAWSVGGDNKLVLRGTVSGTSALLIATLPFEVWPPYDLFFPVSAGSSPTIGRVRVNSTNGQITYSGTQLAQVDLSGISFNLEA